MLEDHYCDATVSPTLKHKPKVLCIAFNFTHRTSFVNSNSFDPLKIDEESQLKLMNRKHNWYITGTGNYELNTRYSIIFDFKISE